MALAKKITEAKIVDGYLLGPGFVEVDEDGRRDAEQLETIFNFNPKYDALFSIGLNTMDCEGRRWVFCKRKENGHILALGVRDPHFFHEDDPGRHIRAPWLPD